MSFMLWIRPRLHIFLFFPNRSCHNGIWPVYTCLSGYISRVFILGKYLNPLAKENASEEGKVLFNTVILGRKKPSSSLIARRYTSKAQIFHEVILLTICFLIGLVALIKFIPWNKHRIVSVLFCCGYRFRFISMVTRTKHNKEWSGCIFHELNIMQYRNASPLVWIVTCS